MDASEETIMASSWSIIGSFMAWTGLATIAVLATTTFILFGYGIYMAFFHPLAKYPGPFLAKFTNLYSAYHAWKGDIHIDIYRCHQKYGEHLRYAPNRLIVNTEKALRDIYGHHGKVIKFKNYEVLSRQAANLLTIRDKTVHGKRRRVLSQAFSENSLRLFEPKIQIKIDRLVQILRQEPGNPNLEIPEGQWTSAIDMADSFNNLAFDIMTTVSFDADFDTLGNPECRYAMHAIELSNVRLGVLLQSQALAFHNLDKKLFPTAIAGRHKFVRFIRRVLAARLGSAKTGSRDLFSFLQECKDPETGKELTTAELSTETATFIVAGADTSSTTMAAVAHYLTGSSECYRKVAEEVRSTFTSVDEICLGPKLNSCAFLRACIDEALRLSPPGGAALWREVESGGTTIDGSFVPAGCEVAVGIYSIHHHSEYYKEPFRFDPERWYRPASSKTARTDSSSRLPYMPFSVGPRSCIGKPLAIANLMLVFARLFMEFDMMRADSFPGWERGDATPTEYALKDHLTAWKEGPVLRFRPRSKE